MLARSPEPEAHDKVLDNNPDQIGIWKCWFLRRWENLCTRRKTSQSKEENQQETQPKYDAGSGNRSRDTLVEAERSHHCAIPVWHKNKLGGPLFYYVVNISLSCNNGMKNVIGNLWWLPLLGCYLSCI